MVQKGDVPPHQGRFNRNKPPDPNLKIELLLIERCIDTPSGPWRISGALNRQQAEPARWVPGWIDETYEAEPEELWAYLDEKGGGNGITWKLGFLRIATPGDAPQIAAYYDDRFRKEEGGPNGLTASPPAVPSIHEPHFDEAAADSRGSGHPCATHVHVEMPLAAADPLTWRLAVELVRRHPEELWVLRTYPMDGAYDCLSIRRLPDVLSSPTIAINRNGTHVQVEWFGRQDKPHQEEGVLLSWGNGYSVEDPREWVAKLELAAGLDSPGGGLPPSTRSSLVLRWIAAFLAMQIGSRPRWSAWNDWAGLDIQQERPSHFDAVPEAAEWLRARHTADAAAFVWFVGTVEGGQTKPELVLCVDGHLWRAGQEVIDLPAAYRSAGSSLASLVASTTRDLLP